MTVDLFVSKSFFFSNQLIFWVVSIKRAVFCLRQAVGDDNGSAVRDEAWYFNFFEFQRPGQYHCLNIIYCTAVELIRHAQRRKIILSATMESTPHLCFYCPYNNLTQLTARDYGHTLGIFVLS